MRPNAGQAALKGTELTVVAQQVAEYENLLVRAVISEDNATLSVRNVPHGRAICEHVVLARTAQGPKEFRSNSRSIMAFKKENKIHVPKRARAEPIQSPASRVGSRRASSSFRNNAERFFVDRASLCGAGSLPFGCPEARRRGKGIFDQDTAHHLGSRR